MAQGSTGRKELHFFNETQKKRSIRSALAAQKKKSPSLLSSNNNKSETVLQKVFGEKRLYHLEKSDTGGRLAGGNLVRLWEAESTRRVKGDRSLPGRL